MKLPTATFTHRSFGAWVRRACVMSGLLVAGIALVNSDVRAGPEISSASAAEVKVAFLYNFGKFIEWPNGMLSGAAHFDVCTIGDIEEFRAALSGIEGRRLQGLDLHVHELGKSTDFAGCQTLLIARSERDRVREILGIAHPLHILTVSDIDDFAESGGIIGLLMRNGRVQFNINSAAAKSAGLSPSSELMGLARTVLNKDGH
jgi:hypothetical protein